ncbi:MAG TPA: four helix bundle protein [Acidobacteriaceae bacterium]|nr:four helix bundle protein [Acidobacteriaceae bacterium]
MQTKPVRGYRDLIVWQRAMELCVALYHLTQSFPREEIYGLTNQMRRASVSIASNIAEGQGRLTREQYRHFLGIARGSSFEIETQILIAKELGFADAARFEEVEKLSDEVGKMLTGLVKKLQAP